MGLRAWSVASAPDRLRSKPLQPPPDVEGAVAPYLVQDRIPWKRGTPSGVGAVFLQLSRRFPNTWSRGSATRGALHGEGRASARPLWNTGKKQALLWLIFMGETMGKNRGKHQYFPYFQKMTASLRKGRSYPRGRRDGAFAAGMGCEWLARAPCAVVCNWARRPERAAGEGAGWGGKRLFDLGTTARAPSPRRGGASGEGGGLFCGFPAVFLPQGRAEARPSRGALHGVGHASACPQWKQLARQRGPELPARQRRAKVR